MNKHTPGPWRALPEEFDKPYVRIRGTQLGGRYKIANVLTPTYEGVHEREALETRANARLIAAAPDLLDVLEHIYYSNEIGFLPDAIQSRVHAVIAKAKGHEGA